MAYAGGISTQMRHAAGIRGLGGLALGSMLCLGVASAQPAAPVRYVYKAVPCTPCPCECPDSRPKEGPAPAASVYTPPPSPTAPVEPETPAKSPREAPAVSQPAAAARPVDLPKGGIGGVVAVRDRAGKEKTDRSDVVIYLEHVPRKYQVLKRVRQMAQRDKAFVPRLIAVTKGSTVDFPNEDKLFHNVFSLSDGNTFDLGLYRAGESKSMTFDKTGVVDVYCNIHPNMWAQILVLDNPFFTTSTKDGTFDLSKVPPGSYTVAAWVSGGEAVKQQVKVEPGKRAELKFEVREGAGNKPHLNKFNQPYDRYK